MLFIFFGVLFVINCSSTDEPGAQSPASGFSINLTAIAFGETLVLGESASQTFIIQGSDLSLDVSILVTGDFKVSKDDSNFSSQISLDPTTVNNSGQTVYVRFTPSENAVGLNQGSIALQSANAPNKTLNLTGVGLSITPIIMVDNTNLNFDDTPVASQSNATIVVVNGDNLTSSISLVATEGFELSLDASTYSPALQIPVDGVNSDTSVYVRFAPTVLGDGIGTLTLTNNDTDPVDISLTGFGLAVTHNYVAFDSERLAFGGGFNQSSTQTFNLHDDLSAIETIKMYVQLRCPSGGCDEWDVYANVKVKDPASGELYELGRYITPYWNDNSQLERGFEFDVTDFKSLLSGATELRIRTECWNSKGYEVTVDFDYIEGVPDYPYYAISRVIAYDDWSSSGVPYGVNHSLDLDKTVAIPSNAESTHLRSIISGWGHATPEDSDGRGCAEWCYRMHEVKINGATMFMHDLAPLGCESNPVSNQSPGNWQPNRAGWCPGMEVPIRLDQFDSAMAGSSFAFEYDYEDWVNNGGNGNAFYATSTFVVVKSNTPIAKPVVNE
jgi:hypothetical protein